MLHNKYQKFRTTSCWQEYRKQRNLVTKCKRKSINQYFTERCLGGPKSKDFWPTIKPFLTNKGNNTSKDTILSENDHIITDQQDICDIFNNFFVNVAKDIGDPGVIIDEKHPSIVHIDNIMNCKKVYTLVM